MNAITLDELRELVDDIDDQIVGLLNKRAATALDIGKAKSKLSKNAYDPTREQAVLERLDKLNEGPLPKGSLEDIYASIITACREIQIKQS